MTDPLLARLAAADPVPVLPAIPAPVAAAEVAALVAAVPRPAPRRRRRRTATLAVLAALVAVPAGAAAMEVAGLHTGVFPGRGDTESVAGEEYLDTGSPQIAAVAEELTRGLPLPAGARWAPFLERWPAPEGGLMQRTGIAMQAEAYARCAWLTSWLGAHRDGDAGAAREAAAVLRRSATWPATAATDGGGVVASLTAVADAAAAGDPGPVRQEVAANC